LGCWQGIVAHREQLEHGRQNVDAFEDDLQRKLAEIFATFRQVTPEGQQIQYKSLGTQILCSNLILTLAMKLSDVLLSYLKQIDVPVHLYSSNLSL
jgi:hypothetical protein